MVIPEFVQVLSIEIEQLKEKINAYNLNVLGYHTYVVGKDLLVVHNRCQLSKNMEKRGNARAVGEDAHHLFLQKFVDKFEDIGIKINDASNGVWMDASKHRSGARAYNKLWEEVLGSGQVNVSNAMNYAKKFMKLIYDVIL